MANSIENDRHKISIQELLPHNIIHSDRFFEVLSQSRENLLRDQTTQGAEIEINGASPAPSNVIIELLFLYKVGINIFNQDFEALSEIRRLFSFDSKQFVSLIQSDQELLTSVNLSHEIQLTANERNHITEFINELFEIESSDETIDSFFQKAMSFQFSPDFSEIGTISAHVSFVFSRNNYMEEEFEMINRFSNSDFCEVSLDDMTTIFERVIFYLLALRRLHSREEVDNLELQKTLATVRKALERFIARSPDIMSKLSDKHERKIRHYMSRILLSAEPNYAIEGIPERHLGTGINTNYFSIEKQDVEEISQMTRG